MVDILFLVLRLCHHDTTNGFSLDFYGKFLHKMSYPVVVSETKIVNAVRHSINFINTVSLNYSSGINGLILCMYLFFT